jgi:hypothetical protein
METILHGDMAFSYVIALDPIVAGSSQLFSKYGNPITENTKVLCSEDEMWQDEGSCTTKVYLEGSVLEMYDSVRAQGTPCFYVIQLDSVRAVDSMLRLEHRIDLYSDAYNSQAMLWQNDAEAIQWHRIQHAIAVQTAVASAVVAPLHQDSVAESQAYGPLSFAWEHYSSPCSASAPQSPCASQGSSDADHLDAAESHSTAGGVASADRVPRCAYFRTRSTFEEAEKNTEKHTKRHEGPRFDGEYARKMRWRRELPKHVDGMEFA